MYSLYRQKGLQKEKKYSKDELVDKMSIQIHTLQTRKSPKGIKEIFYMV